MSFGNDREYHLERAKAERDLGDCAAMLEVAQSHFRLSELHLERARQLSAPAPQCQGMQLGWPAPAAHNH